MENVCQPGGRFLIAPADHHPLALGISRAHADTRIGGRRHGAGNADMGAALSEAGPDCSGRGDRDDLEAGLDRSGIGRDVIVIKALDQ